MIDIMIHLLGEISIIVKQGNTMTVYDDVNKIEVIDNHTIKVYIFQNTGFKVVKINNVTGVHVK